MGPYIYVRAVYRAKRAYEKKGIFPMRFYFVEIGCARDYFHLIPNIVSPPLTLLCLLFGRDISGPKEFGGLREEPECIWKFSGTLKFTRRSTVRA